MAAFSCHFSYQSSCSLSLQYEWHSPSFPPVPANHFFRGFSCFSITELHGSIVRSVEEGMAGDGDEFQERAILRISRPPKIVEDTSFEQESLRASLLSKPLRFDLASIGDEQQVTHLDLMEKSVAVRGLFHELEAHKIDCLSDLSDQGHIDATVEALDSGDKETVRLFTKAISHLLQKLCEKNDKKEGRRVHRMVKKCGLDSDPFLGTRLILMYTFFECLSDAKSTFKRISDPNVYSWRAIMSAYARAGQFDQVLSIYQVMRSSNVQPDSFVLVSALKACHKEENIMVVHSHVVSYGQDSKIFVGSSLIDMYVKCSRLGDALRVFHGLTTQDVVTWTTLISGVAQQDRPEAALHLFVQMQLGDLQPDAFTFVSVIKACATIGDLAGCRVIHSQIVENGLEMETFVVSAIIDIYAKIGYLNDAQAMFVGEARKSVVTWTAFILGHAQHGQWGEALELFWEMLRKGMMPDNISFSNILDVCASVAAFEQAELAHMHIIECGFSGDLFVGNALVGMYARCGNLEDACNIFEHLHRRSVLTWGTMVNMCAQHNKFTRAVKYFEDMLEGGMKPNSMVFCGLLSACSSAGLVEEGFHYFKLMKEAEFDILAMPLHFYTMADLLGRKGCLDAAEDLLETLHFRGDGEVWLSLLWACYNQGVVGLGRRCFDTLLTLGAIDSAYVLMSSIYAQACMHSHVEKMNETRRAACLPREVSTAYIEIGKQVHAFTKEDMTHPLMEEIASKLQDLNIETQGSHDQGERVDEEVLCGHSEKLAVAFALIRLPPGSVIRVSKNLRTCAACHSFLKVVSKAEARDIVVSIGNGIHRFHAGVCCCKDRL